MKRVAVTILSIIAGFILQTSVFGLVKLANIVPNVMIILVCSTAVMRGQKEGMLAGFFSGLLLDIFYSSYLGGFAFLYMIFGFADGFFNRIYYADDIFLPLVLIGVNDLLYGVIMYIVRGLLGNHLRIFYYFRSIILPEAVYTIAVALVLYRAMLCIEKKLEKTDKGSADFV